jgi:nucleotide-binding universal stress UspA family protein
MASLLHLQREDRSVHAPRPFTRIVVAVDSSSASERAVQLALSLGRIDARTEVVFAHVIDVPRLIAGVDRMGNDYELALQAARDQAQDVLDRCLAAAEDARIFGRSCIRYGKPAAEVVTLARVFGADLIVCGTGPGTRIQRFLNGSVRDEIVRTASVPVLVAHE